MHLSTQEKRLSQYANVAKTKLMENKPHHFNVLKDYED